MFGSPKGATSSTYCESCASAVSCSYEHANAVWTSSRRLTRGLLYNTVVTLVVYYLSAYLLNRVFRRRIVGSAPPCRKDAPRSSAS